MISTKQFTTVTHSIFTLLLTLEQKKRACRFSSCRAAAMIRQVGLGFMESSRNEEKTGVMLVLLPPLSPLLLVAWLYSTLCSCLPFLPKLTSTTPSIPHKSEGNTMKGRQVSFGRRMPEMTDSTG